MLTMTVTLWKLIEGLCSYDNVKCGLIVVLCRHVLYDERIVILKDQTAVWMLFIVISQVVRVNLFILLFEVQTYGSKESERLLNPYQIQYSTII